MPDEPDDMLADVSSDRQEPVGEVTRPHRLRRVLLVVLSAVLVVAVGFGATALYLGNELDENIERFEDPFEALPSRPPTSTPQPRESGEPEPEHAPVNMLVLGSDSRISAGDPSAWRAGAQRTDVIMLVHLAGDRGSAHIMSLPRDLWVPIPGRGEAKINAAFSFGGPTLLIQTVEQLTGVRIDHVAVTDFESFTEITDALGGVDLTLKEDLVDRGRFIAEAGERRLTGEQALVYVRQRKNLARGDFDRVQRQQAWMRAMMRKVTDGEVLKDPTRWYPLLDTITNAVSVDEGFTRDEMIGLLSSSRDLRASDVGFLTVPTDGIGTSADGQSIVLVDPDGMEALMAAVREDRVGEYLEGGADGVDRLPSVAP